MVYKIKLGNRVKKYLKKLKDKQLKNKFIDVIYDEISANPHLGSKKHGDLNNFYTYSFQYNKSSYRIAYEINDWDEIIIVVLVGTRENFYQELRKLF